MKEERCFDTGTNWDKSTGMEQWRKCDMLLVFRIIWVEASTSGINQARDLVSSLDAYVTQGGLCYRVLGIKTKGEDCVKCPDPMYLMR